MSEIKETKELKPSIVDKEKLRDITKAYTEEELNVVIKVIPDNHLWEELMRRETSMLNGANDICEILGASFDTLNPIPIRAWEDIRKRYDDLREKYLKMRKVFGK